MNAAHIHLLVNHLPIFATLLALPISFYGVFSSATPQVLRVMCFLLITAACATGVSMRSGEDAEELIEPMEHVDTEQIHDHSKHAHDAAPIALGTGVLALIAVIVDRRHKGRQRKAWTAALFVVAAYSGTGLVRAGMSGGQIQHREVREGFDPHAPITPEEPLDL